MYKRVEESIRERIRGRGVGERGGRVRKDTGEKKEEKSRRRKRQSGGGWGRGEGGRGARGQGVDETFPDVWPERTSLMMLMRCFGLIHIGDRMNSNCNTVSYCSVFCLIVCLLQLSIENKPILFPHCICVHF